jgi:hypothetical protein
MNIMRRMDISEKVRRLLELPDFTQTKLAKTFEVSQATVSRWAAGTAEPEGVNRDAIHALHQSVFGDAPDKVRLVGYVGAGAAVYPIDDGADEWVDAPPKASKTTTAVQIRGTSQLPTYEDGWIIYYSKLLPPEMMVNRRCVIQLADGRILLKTLRRGSRHDLWTLTSSNDVDIDDVVVEWASPIDWIKPRE